ncbi:DEAD/DEAH box helicase [Streptosporangium sandarakinum]|uniref:DEAD/DEAH box helicase n=1 Tax=Streptosporangium sandarakinum TaxID=1260955 RepID=UPI0036B41035
MTTVPVFLPGPVAVVPSEKVHASLAPRLHPGQLIQEMERLSRIGALPALLEEERKCLVVHVDTHVARLYLSRREDAYVLGSARPRGFGQEERLLRGSLLLGCSAGWRGFHRLRDVPQGMSAHWGLLRRAWSDVSRSAPERPSLPRHHTDHLDLMDRVIEAGRDIEVARQREAPPIHYRRMESAREERRSARGVYTFHLVRPAGLAAGTAVCLADQPDLRGRVRMVRGLEVVVRFESAVDYGRIPAQGALRVMPSERVFQAQADAVRALRLGEAVNRELLTWFVDRRFTRFDVDPRDRPRGALDPDGQLPAFRRALAVPDLLLILGPPGTGKTRTITEIAVACAARGERVLITSHTNRAVDNVLEQLPADVLAVRVGNEDAVTGRARALMVESHVAGLRERILTLTEGPASRLAPFAGNGYGGTAGGVARGGGAAGHVGSAAGIGAGGVAGHAGHAGDAGDVAGRWLAHLADSVAEAAAAERDERDLTARLGEALRRLEPALAERIAAARARLDAARVSAEELKAARDVWERRHAAARARAKSGLLAFLHRWLADRRLDRLRAVERKLAGTAGEAAAAEAAWRAERAEAERRVGAHPETARLAGDRDAARRRGGEATSEAAKAAWSLRAMVANAAPAPGETLGPDLASEEDLPADPAGWEALRGEFERAVGTLRARAALLAEWRAQVGDAEEDLQRELVRYADVVAATCIGTATTKLLAELEFDLVIVDEAGQISTPNLLVPLVRGRRAVLVGDHRQLPPYLDEEVREWGESLEREGALPPAAAREVADLLRRSAFERLYGAMPAGHRVMLAVQRRMPREVGEFVSAAFYDGALRTDHDGASGDPVFSSPFAMVDTSDRPAGERREEPGGRGADGERRGYVNALEAEIVTRLLRVHARYYRDWAVIVPYRAQAERIRTELARVLGEGAEVADNVGTVDSFQGGERDLVVYAFTRSNPRGEVGFLRELRRLNVAVSRARRQLVLVGDAATLTAARDEGFRAVARRLAEHLGRTGDLRPSADVLAHLARLEESP